jgi:hypothetical protein
MEGPKRRKRKNDRNDAHKLARVGRMDPQSLFPINHRSAEVRQDLVAVRACNAAAAVRKDLINATRGLVKSMGGRLPKCPSPSFRHKVEGAIPTEVREMLPPLVQLVETLSSFIQAYDETIDVGPYLGLVSKQEDSGDSQPTTAYHQDGRHDGAAVASARYILGPFGPDTDLRRYGLRLSERGGKNAKKRAVVAVARKLLLHRLWVSGEVYERLRHSLAEATQKEARRHAAVEAREEEAA